MNRETLAAIKLLGCAARLASFGCAANSEIVQLPSSTADRSVSSGVTVTVTKDAIRVDGVVVAPITAGKVDPKFEGDGENGYRIAPLIEALARRTRRRAGGTVDTHVTLVADRATSFRLFTEVVFSCGQVGYDKYDLVVKKPADGSLSAISYTVPPSAGHHEPQLTVWVRRDGFKIAARGAWFEVPNAPNGRYDYERLTARLTELTASAEDVERGVANLVADESVPYEVVIATVDAMRTTSAGAPLFPAFELAAAVN